MILSVGCGERSPQEGIVRLDISPAVKPDIVWDLNNYPYPLKDSFFDEIECLDVIEHVQDIPKTLEQFHRILKANGVLKIITPHFSCANAYIDPTHRYHLSYFSFDYFCPGHKLAYYSSSQYRIKYRHLQFQGGRFARSIVSRLANKFPQSYEQRWSWIFPAWFIHIELEAIK